MEAETATCPRCERRRSRRLKPGRVLDIMLILVLLVDVYVTWGRCPAPAQGACPPEEQDGGAE